MPLNSAQVAQLATSSAFAERIRAVVTLVAIQVRREPPATEKHDARTALALEVLRNPEIALRRMVMVTLAASVLTTMDITDVQLHGVITDAWNDLVE